MSRVVFVTDSPVYPSLPLRLAGSDVDASAPTELAGCVASAVNLCARAAESNMSSFRACLYGVLAGSNLLPAGAASVDLVSEQGAFKTGLALACPLAQD